MNKVLAEMYPMYVYVYMYAKPCNIKLETNVAFLPPEIVQILSAPRVIAEIMNIYFRKPTRSTSNTLQL